MIEPNNLKPVEKEIINLLNEIKDHEDYPFLDIKLQNETHTKIHKLITNTPIGSL